MVSMNEHLIKIILQDKVPFLKIRSRVHLCYLFVYRAAEFMYNCSRIDFYNGLHNYAFHFILFSLSQDDLVTMHDVLDAQWQLDNIKDGMYIYLSIIIVYVNKKSPYTGVWK